MLARDSVASKHATRAATQAATRAACGTLARLHTSHGPYRQTGTHWLPHGKKAGARGSGLSLTSLDWLWARV